MQILWKAERLDYWIAAIDYTKGRVLMTCLPENILI